MRLLLAATAAVFAAAASTLPASGTARGPQVTEGARVFAEACAACHGEDGRAGAGFQTPIWGQGSKIARFENALGLFEYNQMMMPFDDPTKLSDEEKWAVVAYMLANHGALGPDQPLGPDNAAAIPIR